MSKDLCRLTFRIYTYKDLLDFYEANYKKSRGKDDKTQAAKAHPHPHNYSYRELLDFYLTYYLLQDSNGLTIETLEEKIESLKKDVEIGRQREDELKERLYESKKEYQELALDRAVLKDNLHDRISENQKITLDKENLQQNLNVLKSLYNSSLQEKHHLAVDNNSLKDTHHEVSEKIEQLNRDKKNLQVSLQACLEENQQLKLEKQKAVDDLSQLSEDHQKELEITHAHYKSLFSENKKLTDFLQTIELQKKNHFLEEENKKHQGKLREMQVERNSQKARADKLSEKLGFVTSKLRVSEHECKKLKYEVSKLTAEIKRINFDLEKCMDVIDDPAKLRTRVMGMKATYPESYEKVQLDDETKEAYEAEIGKLHQTVSCCRRINLHTSKVKERLQKKVHTLLKRNSNSMESPTETTKSKEYLQPQPINDKLTSSVIASMDDTTLSEETLPKKEEETVSTDRPSVIGPMDKYVRRV